MRGWLAIRWVPLAPVLRTRPCAVPDRVPYPTVCRTRPCAVPDRVPYH